MKQYSLNQILNTLETTYPLNALPSLPCTLCGETNRAETSYPDPVYGEPEKQLVQFTCVHCGFFQEEVV